MKRIIALIVSVLLGVGAGVLAVTAAAEQKPSFSVNESGIAYGNYLDDPSGTALDMFSAIGVDGTKGYVYYADAYGDQPKTPEDARKYMEELEARHNEAVESGEDYLQTVPLYDVDGKTVIGEYGIGPLNLIEYLTGIDKDGNIIYFDIFGNPLEVDEKGRPILRDAKGNIVDMGEDWVPAFSEVFKQRAKDLKETRDIE
ncbi:MAG: hypothetical protein LBR85_09540 [Oscillospiraceae bacterium]|nr:hypothetical protein [Oscillospiraceae bacterium]